MGMNERGDELIPLPATLEELREEIGTREDPREINYPVFREGEVLEIRGVDFEVAGIGPQRLVLRPRGWTIPKASDP